MKMSRTFGCRFILLVGILAMCVAQINIVAASDSGQLVSPELLRHAGLKTIWESELPIRKAESLEQLLILGNRIYAISDRNYMTSLNKENGERIFAKVFAPSGVPIAGLKDDKVDAIEPITSKGKGSGYVFNHDDADSLLIVLEKTIDLFSDKRIWQRVQKRGLSGDFSWAASACELVDIYEQALKRPPVVEI